MSELFTRFDSVFFEKTRLTIMTLLFREECLSYKNLKDRLELSDGALYSHLEKLREGGYVERNKEIVENTVASQYRLSKNGKQTYREYIDLLESLIRAGSTRKD